MSVDTGTPDVGTVTARFVVTFGGSSMKRTSAAVLLFVASCIGACDDAGTDSSPGDVSDAAADTPAEVGSDATDDASADVEADTPADVMSDATDDAEDDDTADASVEIPPGEPGPFRVAAMNGAPVERGDERTLPITIWYPTEAETGDPFTYQVAIPGGLTYAQPAAAFDSAPVSTAGPFPLLVFSHGNSSFRSQSYFLTEHLASRGFIVIAPDHVGNDTSTYEDDAWIASAVERPHDVAAMIDAAETWSDETSHPLHGAVDMERVGVAGHSFGGFTVFASAGGVFDMVPVKAHCDMLGEDGWNAEWAFCDRITSARMDEAEACSPCDAGDARIDAALAMAPAFAEFFVEGGLEDIDVPVLVMAGTLDDPWSPAYAQERYVDRLTHEGSRLWVLDRGSHYSFSNACSIQLLASIPLFGCTEDVIEPEEGYAQIRAEATAFFESRLMEE